MRLKTAVADGGLMIPEEVKTYIREITRFINVIRNLLKTYVYQIYQKHSALAPNNYCT